MSTPLDRAGLGGRITRLLDEHWPGSGVNGWALTDWLLDGTDQSPEPAAVQALREYAAALRGDWSDFDGRSSKITLNEFADAIMGGQRADWTIERWRQDNSICPTTGTHWTRHCDPGRCGNEPSSW